MLNIDKLSHIPIYEQVIEQMHKLIVSGSLKPGDQIPSVRSLSMDLSINPNTIQKAYNELELRRVTYSVPGVGRYVSDDAPELRKAYYVGKLSDVYDALLSLAVAGGPEEQVADTVRRAYESAKQYKEKRGKVD